MADVPHFALPFRWGGGGHASVVEQDTPEDVAACVAAALRTERGTRGGLPSFGVDDQTFERAPGAIEALLHAAGDSEPRAALELDSDPDVTEDGFYQALVRLGVIE